MLIAVEGPSPQAKPTRTSEPRSDRALLRAAPREPSAFGEFYDRHSDAVLAFLYRRTDDAELAADLAAETFVQAYLSRRRFDGRTSSARGWLLGIARFKLMRTLRKGRTEERARRRLGYEAPAFLLPGRPNRPLHLSTVAEASSSTGT